MDRGAWWATVHGVTESDMTERPTLSLSLGLFSLKLPKEGISFLFPPWE